MAAAAAKPDEAPDDLLDAEVLDRAVESGALEPTTYGAAAAQHPLHQVGGRPQDRAEDLRRGRGRRRRHGSQHRDLAAERDVADVGQDADGELGTSENADPQHHEHHPETGGAAEEGTPHRRAHDRIRFSTGSRPMRIIAV